MSNCHPQVYHDTKSLLKVSSRVQYTSACPLNSVLQALAPSRETLQTRHALLERLREIIQSDMGDDFDVEDISMRNYANDLDIAPMELMIVVRAVMSLALELLLTGHPRTFISRILWRCPHFIRTTVAPQGFALARTSATSPMFITRGGLLQLCA